MPLALDTLTGTYEDVRSFGQDVLDLVSVSYGAITTCLLPILYALLGPAPICCGPSKRN